MSFNETRELEQLPDKIAALEAEQHEIEAKLADPKFFAANALEATRISTRHAELLHELEAAYARWTELEDKRVTLTST